MSKRTLSPLLAAPLLSAVLIFASGPARASALTFGPCASEVQAGFACATLPVPLDRSGQIPGAISLQLERSLAGATPSRDAVIALAGGPGQAALGLGEFIAKA